MPSFETSALGLPGHKGDRVLYICANNLSVSSYLYLSAMVAHTLSQTVTYICLQLHEEKKLFQLSHFNILMQK